LAGGHERGGTSKFVPATLDSLAVAVEKLSNVADAAVTEFERFGGGVKSALSFVEGSEGKLHGLLDRSGVWRKHDGIQPKGKEILSQDA
jgi:hypothetical protein